MSVNVGVKQKLKIIAGVFEGKSDNIGANAVAVVRVAAGVVFALIFGIGGEIGTGARENVGLVVDAVVVGVLRTDISGDIEVSVGESLPGCVAKIPEKASKGYHHDDCKNNEGGFERAGHGGGFHDLSLAWKDNLGNNLLS